MGNLLKIIFSMLENNNYVEGTEEPLMRQDREDITIGTNAEEEEEPYQRERSDSFNELNLSGRGSQGVRFVFTTAFALTLSLGMF